MNARERFLTTINSGIPDRPPLFATFTPQVAKKMSAEINLPYEEPLDSLLSTRISHMNLLTTLGNDAVGIAACVPDSHTTIVDVNGIISNEWGMRFKNIGLYNEFIEYPLSGAVSAADIEDYPFPSADAEGRFRAAEAAIKKYGTEYGIIADLETSIFETAWYLVGLEKLLTDMITGAPYVDPLFDKIMNINIKIGQNLIQLGADMIWAGDDFGGQNGMIISPETWRQVFKPRIKYMFESFRKINPNIKIAWHSCGSILPIIPDFIDIGLDILNPIQPLAKDMDYRMLKKRFGRDLIFFGGIDVQQLLPFGTPDQIKEAVKERTKILGANGGYIVGPAHNIQNDTPIENVLTFFDAVTGKVHE
jgi:uroporphyrinogen decarboxylase